jgi:hypothetical protein
VLYLPYPPTAKHDACEDHEVSADKLEARGIFYACAYSL